jgi:hypothetical protein
MKATPKGVRKSNDNLMKRNEQPQMTPTAKYAGSHDRDGVAGIFAG